MLDFGDQNRMEQADDAKKTGRSKTGISGLDDILNGGLIPHRLYLIDGDPGAGKTTLALQYLIEGAKHGEKCLYARLLGESWSKLHDSVRRSHPRPRRKPMRGKNSSLNVAALTP